MPARVHVVRVSRGFVLRLYKELIGCRGGMCALCPRLCATRARVVVTRLVTSRGKMVGSAAELRSAQSASSPLHVGSYSSARERQERVFRYDSGF